MVASDWAARLVDDRSVAGDHVGETPAVACRCHRGDRRRGNGRIGGEHPVGLIDPPERIVIGVRETPECGELVGGAGGFGIGDVGSSEVPDRRDFHRPLVGGASELLHQLCLVLQVSERRILRQRD